MERNRVLDEAWKQRQALYAEASVLYDLQRAKQKKCAEIHEQGSKFPQCNVHRELVSTIRQYTHDEGIFFEACKLSAEGSLDGSRARCLQGKGDLIFFDAVIQEFGENARVDGFGQVPFQPTVNGISFEWV